MNRDRRKSNLWLPTPGALEEIIAREAQRKAPSCKANSHFHNLDTIKEFGTELKVSTEFLVTDKVDAVLNLGRSFVDEATNIITSHSPSEINNAIYDYLAETDDITDVKADFIFVFGADTTHRIEKAVELYKAGLSDTLVLSGGTPNYIDNYHTAEAIRDRDYALKAGIPEDKIIIEPRSISIADNVRATLNMLDEMGFKWEKAIIVNSPYVQRRGWGFFMKYINDDQVLYRVNASTSTAFSRDNWYKSKRATNIVLNELVKLKVAIALNTS